MTLLRMLAFQPERSASTKDSGPKRAAASVSTAAIELKPVEPPQAKPKVAVDKSVASWKAPVWGELVPQLDINGANRMLANNCAYLRREGNVLFLSLDIRSESLLTRVRKRALADALTKHFGEPLTLDISLQESVSEAEAETPHQEAVRDNDARLDAARLSLENDPGVHALQSMFGAHMKTDSVEIIDKSSASDQE